MTDMDFAATDKKRRLKKTMFSLGLGAISGFVGATLVMQLLDSDSLADVGASVEIAVLVALVYLLIAIAVGVGVLSPKAGASFLNVEDADELEEQRSILGYSAIGMAGAGIALAVVALSGPDGLVEPRLALGLYVVLSVLAVWVSLKSWKLQDELMKAIGREAAGMSFYLVLLVGGTWALLAHLGFVAAPRALDWLSMFWALLLLAAFIVVGKRGMLMMR